MAVPSEAEVRDLFIGDTDANTDAVTFYAEWANDVVQANVPTADYASDVVNRVTRLVAAHGVAATDPTEAKETAGDRSATYEGPSDVPLDLGETRFGRRAIALVPELGNVGGETSVATFHGPTGG